MNICDFGHTGDFEVRFLPIGGAGNIIICPRHFEHEMNFRLARITLGVDYDLPLWAELEEASTNENE